MLYPDKNHEIKLKLKLCEACSDVLSLMANSDVHFFLKKKFE